MPALRAARMERSQNQARTATHVQPTRGDLQGHGVLPAAEVVSGYMGEEPPFGDFGVAHG